MKLTLLLLYGLLQMAISSPVQRDSQGNYEGLCTTDECIEVSYRLIKNMNKSADPCEDFYQFACGKFIAEARIPDDKSKWSAFEPLQDEIYLQGKLLLEEEPTKNDFESYKLAKDHYKACTNEDKLEELGVEPLLSKLKSFGGWPLLEGNTWDSDSFSWWEWTYKMNEDGFEIDNIIDFAINTDDKNTTTRVIKIDQPQLGLSREYMIKGFDDKDVQQYYKYMVDIAVLLGAESKKAEKELKDSLLFEIELALITAPKEERRNVSALYNPTTLSEVPTAEGLPPSWTKFAQRMLQLSKSLIITENEKVILTSQDFLQKLGALISKTDKRTLANYLAWRAAKYTSSILNAEALKIRQRFNKAIKGIQNEPPTWKRCVKEVGFSNYETSNFIYAADSMYVRRYFKPEAKTEMNEMAIYLRQSFENVILKNIDWMNDNVKERAKQKLSLMDQFIAYSDEYLEKDKIDGLYEGLKISQDDFFGNTLRLVVFWRIDQYKKLREKFDPKSWKEHPLIAVVNAFYFGGNNYMEFPAGILQGSFYTYGAPKYINFGAIGTVIGHEITHGFDDKGKQRNQLGEIENWWDPITEETYKKKADCMIDQYSKKISKQVGMNLNGISTQGENIADNGGLKESYHAYLQWVKDNDEEPQLPGLNYTPRQMFWLGFSQLTCTKYHDVALKENILTDSHSPGEFRLNVPLANIEDFARDYNCPLGSKMNPVDKCAVW